MSERIADEDILMCKVARHAWERVGKPLRDPQYQIGGIRVWLRCVRCGTERTDLFTSYGRLNGRTYTYPAQYKEESYRFTKDDVYTAQQYARMAWIASVGFDE